MFVIGTSGHVDHGKSTLVTRLTGVHPDRLAEEKRRGMTIDLGFAVLQLPSGETAGVVDVPGHERFVRHMVAGVGGIDVVLLVIAADEGVMAQTREHLAILELLGIERGVVALTKIDLVDAEWLDLVREEVRDVLRTGSLARAAVVPVSSKTGEGIEALLDQIDRVGHEVRPPPDPAPAWLPVDRVFTLDGFGRVATGTLHGGALAVGEMVECLPHQVTGRIRGLQTHHTHVPVALPGSRVAVNLTGPAARVVTRGTALSAPGAMVVSSHITARVWVPAGLPNTLADLRPHGGAESSEVTFHIGAAESPASVQLLSEERLLPGEYAWADIRMRRPTPLVRGQRFVLRLPAPVGTIAGGCVADVWGTRVRPLSRRIDRLRTLVDGNLDQAVTALLEDGRRRTSADVALELGASPARIDAVLGELDRSGTIVRAGDSVMPRASWERIVSRTRDSLATYHNRHPLRDGVPLEQLRQTLRLEKGEWEHLLPKLRQVGVVAVRNGCAAEPGRANSLDPADGRVQAVVAALKVSPFAPESGGALLTATGASRELMRALARDGLIVALSDDVWLDPEAYDEMLRFTMKQIETNGQVTVVEVRERFATSRKYAVAFLEHLDAEKYTRRQGDARVAAGRKAS